MFAAALIILILFTLLYGLFASAIFYHLKQYTIAGHPQPRIITLVFFFLSGFFWLSALYFLFQIPS